MRVYRAILSALVVFGVNLSAMFLRGICRSLLQIASPFKATFIYLRGVNLCHFDDRVPSFSLLPNFHAHGVQWFSLWSMAVLCVGQEQAAIKARRMGSRC